MRQILVDVLEVANDNDPMALIRTTREERAVESRWRRVLPLAWDPPPDTLFMRATGLDLGVFGEDLGDGHLQMIDAAFSHDSLRDALDGNALATVEALHAHSRRAPTATAPEAIAAALASGEWPGAADVDAHQGAILQAAGFARQLLVACAIALPNRLAVVWEFIGGHCRYDYPLANP
jgi:hypothetical protein